MLSRTLAQMVRFRGQILRLAVVERESGVIVRIFIPGGEIHSTAFFNGLILLVAPDASVPQSVRAADALAVAQKLPEPAPGQPYVVAEVPFV